MSATGIGNRELTGRTESVVPSHESGEGATLSSMGDGFWDRRRRRRAPRERHEDLGRERSRYTASESYLTGARRMGMVLRLIGFAGLGFGAAMSRQSDTVWWEGVGPAILGLAFLLLGEVLGRQGHRAEELDVRFFERGMSYPAKGSEVAIRWSRVRTYLDPHSHRRRGWKDLSCRFEEADGTVHVLRIDSNQVPDIQRLQFEIVLGCSRAHRDKARAAWQAGETLDFGPLQVSPDLLRSGNTVIEWDKVESARASKGLLRIRRKGRRLDWVVRLATIPNVPVLLDLLKDRLTEPAGFSDLTAEFGSDF